MRSLLKTNVIKRTAATALLAGLLWTTTGLAATAYSLRALQNGNVVTAARAARVAQPIATSLSLLTFRQSPDLQLWSALLALIRSIEKSVTTFEAHVAETQQVKSPKVTPQPLLNYATNLAVLAPLSEEFNNLLSLFKKSHIQSLLSTSERNTLNLLSPLLTASPTLLTSLSEGTQTWLVLFQNNDELRAMGGFAGSYALVTLNEGAITEIAIEDIYDADGQFTGFVHAPPGVQEFLSSGNGLRLPDANWSPDFPTASQQILQFFAFGQRQGISGVIAINQEVARDLLRITGPLQLPDYDAVLTAENIDSTLRTGRGSFFPGSIQKKHLIEQAFTQIKLSLSAFTREQFAEAVAIIPQRLLSKDIQVFASDPQLQEHLDTLGITGRGTTEPMLYAETSATKISTDFYLLAVESNVGINKANAGITRQQEVHLSPEKVLLTTTWQNQNFPSGLSIDPADLAGESTPSARTSALAAAFRDIAPALNELDSAKHLAYVNYHRFWVQPESVVQNIVFEGKMIPTWQEQLVTTAAGETFKEIGVLVVVPEQQQGVLEISLTPAASLQAKLIDGSPITATIQKQSGAGAIPMRIVTPTAASSFILTEDTTAILE